MTTIQVKKKVFDGQCARQKTQMLRVAHENTYIIELKSHIIYKLIKL